MNRHAIYHITDTPYAYGKDLNTLSVTLRTAKDDIKECIIYYKDRYDWENDFNYEKMTVKASTELFDFYQIDISVDRNRYRYYFRLTDYLDNVLYLDERGLRNKEIDRKEATAFQYPYIAEADLYSEASWLQESIVYQIFVDRFCKGEKSKKENDYLPWGAEVTNTSMFGGDIKGIISKLDYLKELGVNLLYLTPIFKSSSNHKYNTCDYYSIDEEFGDVNDAIKLVQECHKRDIRIVFDAVFNHSGNDFFAFKDILKNGEASKYKDWYFIDSYPVDEENVNYYTFANDVRTMPKFNTNNKEVSDYLLDVGEYWVREVGIDGWRLDVCDEVDHSFWRKFHNRIKSCNKDAIIVGEIMHEASSFLKGDQMDSIMNYPFKGAMIDFFAKRSITAEQFNEILAQNTTIYMESITRQLWNLFGSHDTSRFLTECNNDVDRMLLAIAFQFTYIGVPYIYYGDEVGLTGGEEPQSRKCMNWEEEKQNNQLLNLYKRLIKIRKENRTLVYGSYNTLYCKEDVIVFKRVYKNEEIVVVINNSDKKIKINKIIDGLYEDLIIQKRVCIESHIEIDSMKFKILKRIDK